MPIDVTIRPFLEDDRPLLREIYRVTRAQAFHWLDGQQMRSEDFDHDTEGERIWVAERGRPLGFVSAWEPENFIHNLFVHPDAAGRGVGSALLDACLVHLGRPATLKCLSRSTQSRDFYLHRGWRVTSEDVGPDGKYLLMRLDDHGTPLTGRPG